MIVIYTSLRAIPAELYEAARLDGASELQIALRIKIPIVAPVAGADLLLLDHRHAPGVHRADHPASR